MKATKEDVNNVAIKILGGTGKMIGRSKGRYRYENPTNMVIFNANICTEKYGKVWFGDVDVTLVQEELEQLATALKEKIYVLYESDARFDNEDKPKLENAVFITDGTTSVAGDKYNSYSECKDGTWLFNKEEPVAKKELPEYDDTDQYKESDFVAYKMPLKKFKSKDDNSPIGKFGEWVVKEVTGSELNETKLGITDIYFTNENMDILKEYMKDWYMKYHGFKDPSYDLQKNMAWMTLDMPCEFRDSQKGPRWIKKGYVYIKKSFFDKKGE